MESASQPQKLNGESVETPNSPSRRATDCGATSFEGLSASPRKQAAEEGTLDKPPRRRFLPQPFETTKSSSKQKAQDGLAKPARRFAPQLVETSKCRRGGEARAMSASISARPTADENFAQRANELPFRGRFKPELVDTSKRTRRAGDTKAYHPSHRTDAISLELDDMRPSQRPGSPGMPENFPAHGPCPVLSSIECRRLGIAYSSRRSMSRSSERLHSYSTPSLDVIESSESEGEAKDSSMSSSFSSSLEMPFRHSKFAAPARESKVRASSDFLLEHAAKTAERQLRDQALSAFPNDDRHVRVNHYIGSETDDADGSRTANSTCSEFDYQRFGSMTWELKDLRKHAEHQAAKQRREDATRQAWRKWNKRNDESINAWSSPFRTHQPKSREMERMCHKARPPMLGSDLEFPRCSSPEPARFDVTQGSYREKQAMCYLSQQGAGFSPCGEGTWVMRDQNIGPAVAIRSPAPSRVQSRAPSSSSGLWAGMCKGQNAALSPSHGPTGLLTPRVVDEDATDAVELTSNMDGLPPSPPVSSAGVTPLDEKLELEQAVEAEFPDDFVTQVYNYLSLGYPSIAHQYDGELSKITRVSTQELRQDDGIENSRGYIRLGEQEDVDGIARNTCARWNALKLYIHEWARQQPGMGAQDTRQGGFGVAVRRGSWAW